MDKIEKLEIAYEGTRPVFVAGGRVKGAVIVKVTEPTDVRSISITITGHCQVGWYFRRRKRNITASRDEFYMNTTIYLCGSPMNSGLILPKGVHTYPFDFQIPPTLPCSFEHGIGNVRYFCRAMVTRQGKPKSVVAYFTILRHLDLNYVPGNMRLPGEGQGTAPSGCICCCLGDVQAKFRIPCKCFVPGQKLHIEAEVHNNSAFKLPSAKAVLCQVLQFSASAPTDMFFPDPDVFKGHMREVAVKSHGPIEINQSDIWTNESLIVPPLPPSGLEGCLSIGISYHIEFRVNVPRGQNIILTCPIVIGTLPLRTLGRQGYAPVVQQPRALLPPNLQPSAPPIRHVNPPSCLEPSAPLSFPAQASEASATMDEAPPPAYEECVFGKRKVSIDGEHGQEGSEPQDYAPVYPCYRENEN